MSIKTMFSRKKTLEALNEFDQVVVGNSLGKDAWRRLKKNKMAVAGMVVVIIYTLLSAFAGLLPIYPYDEIILDHQHLPPSLTKNSGELMMEKRLQDIYSKAWRAGRLEVTAEEHEMLEKWVAENKITKAWDWLAVEGQRQYEAGIFVFNATEQRTIDRLVDRIATELQVTIKKVTYTDPVTGKSTNASKLEPSELATIYAQMLGVSVEAVEAQAEQEVRAQVLTDVRTASPGLTTEEYDILLETELEVRGTKQLEKLTKDNLYAKVEAQAKRVAEADLQTIISDDSESFPLKRTFELGNGITAKIEATKKHERHYYLGTDYSGRDMLSRIIYGGQVSIAIGFIGTLTSVLIGILLGAIAGYVGGKTDYIIMRIVDIMYGLPYMLLVIICMAVFGRNILNLFFALAMVSWLTIARMVRGQIMSLKNQEFVEAAKSMGASTFRIIARHLVPNSLSIIIVYSTLRIPAFIMQESFLSFLGLGVQAPYASWGSLVGDAVQSMTLYPWKLVFPALAMIIFLFAMNFLGDGLRDAFDPQSKNQL